MDYINGAYVSSTWVLDTHNRFNGISWRYGSDGTIILLPNSGNHAARIYEPEGEDLPAAILGIFGFILPQYNVLVFFQIRIPDRLILVNQQVKWAALSFQVL